MRNQGGKYIHGAFVCERDGKQWYRACRFQSWKLGYGAGAALAGDCSFDYGK